MQKPERNLYLRRCDQFINAGDLGLRGRHLSFVVICPREVLLRDSQSPSSRPRLCQFHIPLKNKGHLNNRGCLFPVDPRHTSPPDSSVTQRIEPVSFILLNRFNRRAVAAVQGG